MSRPKNDVSIAELTLIVRPPGKPAEIRAFTDAQRAEAEAYAQRHGAEVETLNN